VQQYQRLAMPCAVQEQTAATRFESDTAGGRFRRDGVTVHVASYVDGVMVVARQK
jgi:hypothetical protein